MISTQNSGRMSFFKETSQGLLINIYVQPRASRNKIVGLHNGALKISIQAAPVDDAANRMCIEFLSKSLCMPRSAFDIVNGHTSRTKRVLLRCPQASPDGHTQIDNRKDILDRLISLAGVDSC